MDNQSPTICIVVAMAENRCIGRDNDLPWHIPADLRRFKALTTGKPVIMGRKTYQSIFDRLGKPLPGRDNIVVTRQPEQVPGAEAENCHIVPSLNAALDEARDLAAAGGADEIIIGGGAQIYDQALLHADRIYMTVVHEAVDGDAFFPEFETAEWQESDAQSFPPDEEENRPGYTFRQWDRRGDSF